MATCKECLHIAVCGRYSATGGHVKECEHFAGDRNVPGKWIPAKRVRDETEEVIIVADSENPHRLPRVVRRKKAVTEGEFWGISVGFFAHGVKFTHYMPLSGLPEEGDNG